MKRSEDGKHIVVRLSEQDGKRVTLKFPKPVKVLNMPSDFVSRLGTRFDP